MKSLPLPLRVAAGLAATALEHARDLPTRIAGLPVTVASQALQVSMRVQQHVTELAVKGDEALAALRPVEDEPEWATFDEDLADDDQPATFDLADDDDAPGPVKAALAPIVVADAVEPVLVEDEPVAPVAGPASVPNYGELSLAQLRARLRGFDVAALEELLAHERATGNRPSYVGMLTRRLAALRDTPAT
ncbi:lipid droplet-associated protein [Actinokineospora globicatena]|nr:lipid droplet-associated protein [Actinokineospora globicatena]